MLLFRVTSSKFLQQGEATSSVAGDVSLNGGRERANGSGEREEGARGGELGSVVIA